VVVTPFVVGVEKQSLHARRNTLAPLPGIEHDYLPGWFPRGPELFASERLAVRNGFYLPRHLRSSVDVMHLWNRVSCGRRPWGVTFESTLPRGPLSTRVRAQLQRRLTSSRCRFVIGMSDQAVRRFSRTLPDDLREEISGKIARVHPYQGPRIGARPVRPPHESRPLRLVFAGKAFFRKGGEAILRVVESLGEELNLHVSLVSLADRPDYASSALDADHVADIRRRLVSNPRIDWHESVANEEVYALAAKSHIGLLPTMADTFGYSMLEFMSCGRPVITTNVEAATEIVDPSVGWTIPMPLGSDGRWAGLGPGERVTRAAYDEAIETLTDGLGAALRSVRECPDSVCVRGSAAAERVRTRFGSERTRDLLGVYRRTCPELAS
jgi:glycosyltransferase involved in cell wall biosynthesis